MAVLRYATLFLLFAHTAVFAWDDEPLFRQSPFDQIQLTEKNGGGTFDVFPVAPATNNGFRVRFVDQPFDEYRIAKKEVHRIYTFDERVLAELENRLSETSQKVAAAAANDELKSDFEKLFDYFVYFKTLENPPNGVDDSFRRFLFLEAAFYFRLSDWLSAISRFETLAAKDKEYPQLEERFGESVDAFVRQSVEKDDYKSARSVLALFASFYTENTLSSKWLAQFDAEAEAFLNESKKAANEKDWITAYRKMQRASIVSHVISGLSEWQKNLHELYPKVTIGITSENETRKRRLTNRFLFESVGEQLEGIRSVSPIAEIQQNEDQTCLEIAIHKDKNLLSYDLLEMLQNRAKDSPQWQSLFRSGKIETPLKLSVSFQRPHFLPESLLDIPIPGSGPFIFSPNDKTPLAAEYYSNEKYAFAREPNAPKLVVEQTFSDPESSFEAILSGEIDAIDVVAPWHIPLIKKQHSQIQIVPYSGKTVHVLIPNMLKPCSGNRTMRRALLYGLNREKIMQMLGEGETTSGISIKGTDLIDPLGYGYDTAIQPLPYNPKLAIALSLLALSAIPEAKTPIELTLAHPPDELSRITAMLIQRNWKAIGIETKLVVGTDENADFWLAAFPMREPLVDVPRILEKVKNESPQISFALAKLRRASEWKEAAAILREIHRIISEEQTVMPLWQWTEHAAFRKGVQNVLRPNQRKLGQLYENIEKWHL